MRDSKGEVNWRFADIPSELNNDFKVWNGIQKSYQVGFEVYDGAYDNVHQEGYLTTENTGESTEIRALSYISWDTEYRLKLQAWSLDDSTLVAETVILVPVVDILFANDQHVITVLRPGRIVMICMRMVLSLEERKDIEQQNWQDISRENFRWIPTRNLQKLIICIFLFRRYSLILAHMKKMII